MHIPLSPPALQDLLSDLDPERIVAVFASGDPTSPVVGGRYLHWDEIRHRPPPSGLTLEQWWLRLKIARQCQYKELPLLDKRGEPFVICAPEQVQIDLHHIDRDATGHIVLSQTITTGHRDRYLMRSLIEEAITSSQLEGASTTRRVAERMLREGRRPRDASEKMIFNNFRAMEIIRERRDDPITPESILELHRAVTEGTLDNPEEAGRLRTDDDISVRDRQDNTLLHQPPAWQELPVRLERLCEFANTRADATPFVHPVLRAILLHFMMGYDHPFADGNGRTARALFYWSMAKSGYWLTEFISISEFLRQAPSRYVKSYLYTETDGNDATYFAIHQLAIIRKAVQALLDYLERSNEEQRQTERLLSRSNDLRSRLNHRQIALLTHALKHPGDEYRVDSHQRTHGVVYQTARADLLDLTSLGLLAKTQIGKAYVFTAPADLQVQITRLVRPDKCDPLD
ncbi:MAG: fic [Proteobacteria bacterium]|nr:fic [Pseudomonadota bacterium]